MMPDKNQIDGAKAATGMFLSALMDGSVTDLNDDEVFAITGAAASVPGVAGKAFGLDESVGEAFGSERVQDAMLRQYHGELALRDVAGMFDELETSERAAREDEDSEAFRYAGMSVEDVERAQFDASMGDMSAIISAKERFYLG